jgi:hypothetical protein
MGRKDKYSLIIDFAWYLDILVQITLMHGTQHGQEVKEQFIDISIRVNSIRPYAVEVMLTLLLNYHLMDGVNMIILNEVVKAAAWIVGEYSDILIKIIQDTSVDDLTDDDNDDDDDDDDNDDENIYLITGPNGHQRRSNWKGLPLYNMIIDALLHPRVYKLSSSVQSIYLQCILKVFIRACLDENSDNDVMSQMITSFRTKLTVFLQVWYLN